MNSNTVQDLYLVLNLFKDVYFPLKDHASITKRFTPHYAEFAYVKYTRA